MPPPYLGLDYVHVARLLPELDRVETEAAWLDGSIIDNWGYDLHDTPCSEVLNNTHRLIESGVQAKYPLDADLKQVGAEGYVGEPIVDDRGEALGLIVGVTRKPLQEGDMVQANLRILAARMAMEWQQRQTTAIAARRTRYHAQHSAHRRNPDRRARYQRPHHADQSQGLRVAGLRRGGFAGAGLVHATVCRKRHRWRKSAPCFARGWRRIWPVTNISRTRCAPVPASLRLIAWHNSCHPRCRWQGDRRSQCGRRHHRTARSGGADSPDVWLAAGSGVRRLRQ
jgi:hypothetical protein